MLMLMRTSILDGEVVVMVVEVMVVVAVRVISFFEKVCLSVTEVECLDVSFGLVRGDIFDLGEDFVVVVVDDLELEVGAVVRLVWGCLNARLYFLWRLSRMSLEGEMPNVGGHPLGLVMREEFLMGLFFFDGGCLEKVTGSKMEVVVVEKVVGVVERVV